MTGRHLLVVGVFCLVACQNEPDVLVIDLQETVLQSFDAVVADQLRDQVALVHAAASDADRTQALGELALMAHAYELPLATRAYEALSELEPGEPSWPYLLGRRLVTEADLAGALLAFERAAELDRGSVLPLVHRGETAFALGDVAAACEAFDRASRIDEAVPRVLLGRARCEMGREAYDGAQALLSRAAGDAPPRGVVAGMLAEIARVRRDVGALEELRSRVGPERPPLDDPWMASVQARRGGVHNQLQQAQAALLDGRHEEAVAFYRAVLQDAPDTLDAWLNLAGIASLRGDFELAEEAYREVLERDADHLLATRGLGMLALRQGRFELAIAWLSEVAQADPDSPAVLRHLAVAQRASGDRSAAMLALEKQIERTPDDVLSYLWIATIEMESGRHARALASLEEGLATVGGAQLEHSLARLLAVSPEASVEGVARARALMESPALAASSHWEVRRTRAMIAAASGDFVAAVRSQQEVLRIASVARELEATLAEELRAYESARSVTLSSWEPLPR